VSEVYQTPTTVRNGAHMTINWRVQGRVLPNQKVDGIVHHLQAVGMSIGGRALVAE
jgi:hypothetical protein